MSNRNDEHLFKKESHTIDTSRSMCDKEELVNKLQEHDSSVESFKSSHSQVEISYFERSFICDLCLKTMNSSASLLKHNCIHSNKKHFHHDVCQETVPEMGQLSQQKRTDTKERSFQCTVFEQVFPENKIKREKSIQSDVCEQNFLIQICSFARCVPILEKTHQCNLCGKTFSKKCHLEIYIRKHTGEKPFQCVVCEQRFSQGRSLNRHMRSHTEEKPFSVMYVTECFLENVILIGI
ncbi:hypothetical protein TNIN_433431 [Trichonephila inaurata madagascariensis]|uniref:C2H2-type domain-containing protein n=1 Tax=Trichonephila inaurata madagascariensis TaxID=2747483 RepID=A0A8X6Y8D6_9ARAC|nr:hypothetical protein TNIN_433431 [Trichonephila inaurata madagascariensis]